MNILTVGSLTLSDGSGSIRENDVIAFGAASSEEVTAARAGARSKTALTLKYLQC